MYANLFVHGTDFPPTYHSEFNPSPEFMSLDLDKLQTMNQEQFSSIFSKSAVKDKIGGDEGMEIYSVSG